MHTVDLLKHAIQAAGSLGYQMRQEWLDGQGGGDCEINGRKWLFLDLAQAPDEQLWTVVETLRREPQIAQLDMPDPLKKLIQC